MRRIAMTAALLLSALAPASASAAPASAPGVVRLLSCDSALEPADRMAVFEGRMRTMRGATRLQMRFSLQSRTKDQSTWRTVSAPGFGRWLSSDLGIGRYVYTKRVVALVAPARYRTTVRFRWLGPGGRRLASHRSTSPVCRQLDLRPDLRPLAIEARAGADARHAHYVVPVANRGKSAAAPFDVVVTVDGAMLPPAHAPRLAPGERALVEVEGPACAVGSTLTADVDPSGAVDEHAEVDNRLVVMCPGAPA
jgi:CARDB